MNITRQVVPEFTKEQQKWIADVLTPQCCHVIGLHNPDHYSEGTGVCRFQLHDSLMRLVEALGIREHVTAPENAYAKPGCWCAQNTETINEE